MSHDALFGELRSILQRPASVETWDALCKHLDLWPLVVPEEVVGYAASHVGRWPEAVEREAGPEWMEGPRIELLLSLANMAWVVSYDHRADIFPALRARTAPSTLRNLSFSHYSDIKDEGVQTIAAAPSLTNLTGLGLDMNTVSASSVRALVASPHLTSLASLGLSSTGIGDEGLRALLEGPRTRQLTSLWLGACNLSAAGIAALAASPAIAQLRSLGLGRNRLNDASAAALAASPHLSNLTTLDLSTNDLTAVGAAALAASPYLHESIRAQWRRWAPR